MTVQEIVYIILDELKNSSDDSFFTEEHIIFLVNKYRSFILKQRYGTDIKRAVPESNYQTLCLNLERVTGDKGTCYSGPTLISSETVPTLLNIGSRRVFSNIDFTTTNFSLVSRDRFNYVGYNRWLQNIIYVTLGPDHKLYLKSNNPQHLYLTKIRLNGVFEDFLSASELECDNYIEGEGCTIVELLDREFPIEDALVPPLVELVVKELTPTVYKPQDISNNAIDDLSRVQNESKRV